MKQIVYIVFFIFYCNNISAQYYVTDFAGSTAGLINSDALSSKFSNPVGICVDKTGNFYITEAGNNTIRKIDISGNVTTYAGAGIAGFLDGNAGTARFNQPWGICIDDSNNLYISDFLNFRIRKISATGIVSTIAGTNVAGLKNGKGDTAQFNYPRGICRDNKGNLYIADSWNHRIRKIDTARMVSTFAGAGTNLGAGSVGKLIDSNAMNAEFYTPTSIVYDTTDNFYITDAYNHAIRKIDKMGKVTTVAGGKGSGPAGGDFTDGPISSALLNTPTELIYNASDSSILFSEIGNQRIRKLKNGKVETFAGNGNTGKTNGRADSVTIDYPRGLVKRGNDFFFCDFNNHKIRKVEFKIINSKIYSITETLNIVWENTQKVLISNSINDYTYFFYTVTGKKILFKKEGNHLILVPHHEKMIILTVSNQEVFYSYKYFME